MVGNLEMSTEMEEKSLEAFYSWLMEQKLVVLLTFLRKWKSQICFFFLSSSAIFLMPSSPRISMAEMAGILREVSKREHSVGGNSFHPFGGSVTTRGRGQPLWFLSLSLSSCSVDPEKCTAEPEELTR